MNTRRFIAAMLIFAISGVSCNIPQPEAPTDIDGVLLGYNLLIMADGKVELKRNDWSDFNITSFGALLYPGDQLQLSEGASTTVLCENLTTWAVPAGAPSGLTNGCPQVPEPSLVRSQSLIGNTRGSTDPLIPYIVSPRATKLLNPKPVLSWNPVPGAEGYTIRISGTEWQERANTTEFVYPGNPPLQPGQDYLLVVESGNGKSSKDEGMPGLGFSLLPEAEAQRVRADAATIRSLELSDTANTFAVSQIYAGHALYAEAIEMLEGLANDSQAASVHGALGELYQQVGLLMLAESSYSRASELAKAIGDVESAAASQDKLGEIYLAFGNKKEAVRWWTQAQSGYESVGDSQRASQISAQLAELNK